LIGLEDLSMAEISLETASKLVQVLAVVSGVVVSVLSFNGARLKEAEVREKEAQTRRIEAGKPFVELRQRLYRETLENAAVLANADIHSAEEVATARKRFRNLYVAELSMVENAKVAGAMVQLAKAVDPQLVNMSEQQRAALSLAHIIGASFVETADTNK
jgi:hypothetical protein